MVLPRLHSLPRPPSSPSSLPRPRHPSGPPSLPARPHPALPLRFSGSRPAQFPPSCPPPLPRTASRSRDCAAPSPFIPPHFPPGAPSFFSSPLSLGGAAAVWQAEEGRSGVWRSARSQPGDLSTRVAHLSCAAPDPPRQGARAFGGGHWGESAAPRSLQPRQRTTGSAPWDAALALARKGAAALEPAGSHESIPPRTGAPRQPVPSPRAEPGAAPECGRNRT